MEELAATSGQCVADELRHSSSSADTRPTGGHPAWLYHPDQPPRLVLNAAEKIALRVRDEWWRDHPYRPHDPEDSNTPENRAAQAMLGGQTAERETHKASPDDIYEVSRKAARAAAKLLEGGQTWRRFVLCGDPADRTEGSSCRSRFRSSSIRGALGADLVTPDASDDDAFGAWVELLRKRDLYDKEIGREGTIERPCNASAALCEEFATEAYRHVLTMVRIGKTEGAESGLKARPTSESVAAWSEIEIQFLSDERIQVFIQERTGETYNYAEFGFENHSTKKPNRAWVALRELGKSEGEVPLARQDPNWPKLEKRIQEIRRVLRAHFRLPGDPVPFKKAVGYRTAFRISCAPSFDR